MLVGWLFTQSYLELQLNTQSYMKFSAFTLSIVLVKMPTSGNQRRVLYNRKPNCVKIIVCTYQAPFTFCYAFKKQNKTSAMHCKSIIQIAQSIMQNWYWKQDSALFWVVKTCMIRFLSTNCATVVLTIMNLTTGTLSVFNYTFKLLDFMVSDWSSTAPRLINSIG